MFTLGLIITIPIVILSKSKPNVEVLNLPAKEGMYDYQIELHMDTIWLYDNGRIVGVILDDDYEKLKLLILKDNE